jgi:hypothetical protein
VETPDGISSDEVILQFGRVDKDRFCMDVKYPLSVFQAFSICISMLDKGKIADRKGYELLNRIPGMNNRDKAPTSSSSSQAPSSGSNSSESTEPAAPAAAAKPIEVSGSMSGSNSIGDFISKSIPSTDYMKNMFNRKI